MIQTFRYVHSFFTNACSLLIPKKKSIWIFGVDNDSLDECNIKLIFVLFTNGAQLLPETLPTLDAKFIGA